jgi:hypothetical protein
LDNKRKIDMEEIAVPKFVLEKLENTLRLIANTYDSYDRSSCLDRDTIGCLNYVRKLLNGDKITGMERVEPLVELK